MGNLLSVAFGLSLLSVATGADSVTITTPPGAHQPQVAVDLHGNVHLTFGADNKVFYVGSTDAGATFGRPTEVAALASLSLGMRRGPRIAASGDSLVISMIGESRHDKSDGNLYAWRSEDRGASWEGPLRVNDVDASAKEGLHAMAAGPKGELYCAWLDLRHQGTQIFGSRSNDGGATWTKNVSIYRSPDGSVCECCHPSVAVGTNGQVIVMWRNSLGVNRDMYQATSRDYGETFAPAVKLGGGSWQLNACPMDGGAVAITPTGQVVTAWRRAEEVFITRGGALKEQRLGIGLQPWAATDNNGICVVWLSARKGMLYAAGATGDQPVKMADDAQFPVVAGGRTGNGGFIVAWESANEGHPAIKVQMIVSNSHR